METLLKKYLTLHYGLNESFISNISIQTNASYFEIEDDASKETQIHFTAGLGMAAYKNSNNLHVAIINYDKFITSLPISFQHGRERCDLIVYTTANRGYFLLNELKDRKPKNKVRTKSASQLSASLKCLMEVPNVAVFIDQYTIKRCCYFNKQSIPPPNINATFAFNRLNQLTPDGIEMSNADMESYGFKFFQYLGGQAFRII
jgi:hypothetical protein